MNCHNKFNTFNYYELQQEFIKKLNSCFTIILGKRSNGKKDYLEKLGYKVITYKEFRKNKKKRKC